MTVHTLNYACRVKMYLVQRYDELNILRNR